MASTRDEADIDSSNPSGNPQIDALVYTFYWSLLARENFQFTFPDDDSDYRDTRDTLINDYPADDYLGVEPSPVFFKQAVRQAIEEFNGILPFAINEQGDNNVDTQLRYAITETIEGDTHLPVHAPEDDGDGDFIQDQANWMSGDMFFDRDRFRVSDNPGGSIVGTFQYLEILSFTEHALGIAGSAAMLGTAFDSQEFTVRTVRGRLSNPVDFAQTPMMLDIQALQFLYGADFRSRAGSTTYRWDTEGRYLINGAEQWNTASNKIFLTVWDGGGIDTYDFSAFSTNQDIDLTPGRWSNLGTQLAQLTSGGLLARGNVFNALMFNSDSRSLIENAIAGSGNDTVQGNFGHNLLNGGAGHDDLLGRLGFDTLIGGAGNDELFGHERDDTLNGGAGADLVNGGEGFDTAVYADPKGERIVITPVGNPGVGRWDVSGVDQSEGDILAQIEAFLFGAGGDQVTLRDGAGRTENSLNGAGGNDLLIGSNSPVDSDSLIGGAGSDTLSPREGEFKAYGGTQAANGVDWNESRAENDLLVLDRSSFGADYFLSRIGAGLGTFHAFSDDSFARGISRVWYTGSGFNDNLSGGVGDDVLRGNGGRDNFTAYEGHDLLEGGEGDDAISGGQGNDTINGGLGADGLSGEEGDDLIRTGGGTTFEGALGGDGNDTILGSGIDERIEGNAHNDIISTGAGEDQLVGGTGNDKLQGGAGQDFVAGGDDIDTASYSSSNAGVTINLATNAASGGHATDDVISGIENAIGSRFADVLSGSAGNNVLDGLAGNDQLSGGAGRDFFVFTTLPDTTGNFDRITDYAVLADTMRIENSAFLGIGPTGVLAAARFERGPTADDAQDRIIYNPINGNLFFDPDGNGGAAQIRFAVLSPSLTLSNADFVVI